MLDLNEWRSILFWRCRSREGAWIEKCRPYLPARYTSVAPARERGLKMPKSKLLSSVKMSLPRGSVDWKSVGMSALRVAVLGRSREGAWIEKSSCTARSNNLLVAPARERGLKNKNILSLRNDPLSLPRGSVDWKIISPHFKRYLRRSLPRGSVDWKVHIERITYVCICRSREGAWIENRQRPTYWYITAVAPARERGLKNQNEDHKLHSASVAPARERGLKTPLYAITVFF